MQRCHLPLRTYYSHDIGKTVVPCWVLVEWLERAMLKGIAVIHIAVLRVLCSLC